MRHVPLTLLPLLFVACERQPVAPDQALRPAFQATSDWTRGSLFLDFPGVFVACRSETMHFYGEVLYQWHQVTTAAGGYNFFFQFTPATPLTPVYYAVGETSGEVYRFANGQPLIESFHLAVGEVHTYLDRETYVAGNGDKLIVDRTFHMTTNANGQLTVNRFEDTGYQCTERH